MVTWEMQIPAPRQQKSQGLDWLESSFEENDPRLLMDKLTTSQQCTLVVKKANNIASSLLELVLLFYAVLVRPHLECSMQFWIHGHTKTSSAKVHKDD